MRTLHVDGQELLKRCRGLMDGHVKYSLGAKATSLSLTPSQIREIDCSGFAQYLLHHVCRVRIPAGSWHQNKWFKDQQFAKEEYPEVGGTKDNCLRVGYFPRKPGMTAGHIWFVLRAACTPV
jgi:cell wall-associated NlpC family hydrolase